MKKNLHIHVAQDICEKFNRQSLFSFLETNNTASLSANQKTFNVFYHEQYIGDGYNFYRGSITGNRTSVLFPSVNYSELFHAPIADFPDRFDIRFLLTRNASPFNELTFTKDDGSFSVQYSAFYNPNDSLFGNLDLFKTLRNIFRVAAKERHVRIMADEFDNEAWYLRLAHDAGREKTIGSVYRKSTALVQEIVFRSNLI